MSDMLLSELSPPETSSKRNDSSLSSTLVCGQAREPMSLADGTTCARGEFRVVRRGAMIRSLGPGFGHLDKFIALAL